MSGDDDAVLTRAKRGDRSAFGQLVREYQTRVYATALHLMGNHQDADDVAQDAFVRAYRFLPKFKGQSSFYTWLHRITVNTAFNHLRKRKRHGEFEKIGKAAVEANDGRPESLGVRTPRPDEHTDISQRFRQVLAEIVDLSPTLRTTLVLATVEGLGHREIGELLDVPTGTVAWRVNEARKQLKERLASSSPTQATTDATAAATSDGDD